MQVKIYERGCGFPEVDGHVYEGAAGEKVFRVTWVDGVGSTIFTTRDKSGWWMSAEVEEADWSDVNECILAELRTDEHHLRNTGGGTGGTEGGRC